MSQEQKLRSSRMARQAVRWLQGPAVLCARSAIHHCCSIDSRIACSAQRAYGVFTFVLASPCRPTSLLGRSLAPPSGAPSVPPRPICGKLYRMGQCRLLRCVTR